MTVQASAIEAAPATSLAAWFAEFRRLAAEAEERFVAGDLRPAITSLAAVPMIHRMLVEACGELAEGGGEADDDHEDAAPNGVYL